MSSVSNFLLQVVSVASVVNLSVASVVNLSVASVVNSVTNL